MSTCTKCGYKTDESFLGIRPCHLRVPVEDHNFVAPPMTSGTTLHLFSAKVFNGSKRLTEKKYSSVEQLQDAIEQKWTHLRSASYQLFYKTGAKGKQLEPFNQNIVSLSSRPSEVFSVVVKVEWRGFSTPTTIDDVLTLLQVEKINYQIDDNQFPKDYRIEEGVIEQVADVIVNDLCARLQVYRPEISEAVSEYTCREFISPLLVYAVKLVIDHRKTAEEKLMLYCEKEILGRKFHGPVDYTLMYGIIDIVLTEAKKSDLEGGINQNLLQQHSSLEFLAEMFTGTLDTDRKRYREEWDTNYNELSVVTTCGIVTTGKDWILNKVEISTADRVKHVYRSSQMTLTLNSNQILGAEHAENQKSVLKGQVIVILKAIISLIFRQIAAIDDNAALKPRFKKTRVEDVLVQEIDRAATVRKEYMECENNNGEGVDEDEENNEE
jgi:hypothetical protein